MRVSGTNIGHSRTEFVGIRGSLELDIVNGRLHGWHSGWPRATMNGLNGKNVKSACHLKLVMLCRNETFCDNYMHRNGKLGVKNGGFSRGTYLICNTYEVPPPFAPQFLLRGGLFTCRCGRGIS